MGTVCRIGLDIAKNFFQVHGVDKHGKDVFNKKLKRVDVLPFFANLPTCLIGIEACGGAHYWARELAGLGAGHIVRLISPRHVKPFVINNKTDAADARAICEVVGRIHTFCHCQNCGATRYGGVAQDSGTQGQGTYRPG